MNERMLESYIIARDRFLVPKGKMFPSIGRSALNLLEHERTGDGNFSPSIHMNGQFWGDFFGGQFSKLFVFFAPGYTWHLSVMSICTVKSPARYCSIE